VASRFTVAQIQKEQKTGAAPERQARRAQPWLSQCSLFYGKLLHEKPTQNGMTNWWKHSKR